VDFGNVLWAGWIILNRARRGELRQESLLVASHSSAATRRVGDRVRLTFTSSNSLASRTEAVRVREVEMIASERDLENDKSPSPTTRIRASGFVLLKTSSIIRDRRFDSKQTLSWGGPLLQ